MAEKEFRFGYRVPSWATKVNLVAPSVLQNPVLIAFF